MANDEYDRGVIMKVPSLTKSFPLSESVDAVYINDDLELFVAAPWFDSDAMSDDGLIWTERYPEDWWLSGCLPYAATQTWYWRNQFACLDGEFVVGRGRTLPVVRCGFAKMVMNGFKRLDT